MENWMRKKEKEEQEEILVYSSKISVKFATSFIPANCKRNQEEIEGETKINGKNI